jgi:hypothetical protein
LGAIELGGGGDLGKIHQFIKLYFFSADLQNEIKSFDTAIDQYIAEVLQTLYNIKSMYKKYPYSYQKGNEIKSFDKAIDQYIAEVLQT